MSFIYSLLLKSMNKIFHRMFSKKSLPIFAVLVLCGAFIAFASLGPLGGEPPTKYEKIFRNLGKMLSEGHYSPKKIDDTFSKEIFKKYVSALDKDKNFFLKADIQALQPFEDKIDEEINGSSTIQFFPAISALYTQRLLEVSEIYKGILAKPFDFNQNETITLDADKLSFPVTEKERTESWRKRLKFLTLERYSDLLDIREKGKGTEGFVVKSDAVLEAEAREKVLAVMNRMFDRLKNKFTDEERFNILVETIASSMDPHTNFFPPVDKRYFDEQMSGRFYGIGAQLRMEEGFVKVVSLVTGSPAWKSGEMQPGDLIIKVGEAGKEPTDLTGFAIDEAVKVIRGSKGSEVLLTVRKSDGSTKIVSLIRDEIIQDEGFAKSLIINHDGHRIGYIYLPEFYADFERKDGAKSAVDVGEEIKKLKEAGIDGIVMDLRDNGGGSLFDVIQIVGYFVPQGPVVQVKDRLGNPKILPASDKAVLYDGPLAVMVNELSASASEIFAAAIQDYKRGVIIGSTSTYGKGTVQRPIGLDMSTDFLSTNSELGSVKLTLQKFYRINGGSTQLRGVASDIVLPDVYEYSKIREKDNPDALVWDEINKASYQHWSNPVNIPYLKQNSAVRAQANPVFETIKKNSKWLADVNEEKTASLNLTKYRNHRKEIAAKVGEIENALKNNPATILKMEAHSADLQRLATDTAKLERFNEWMKRIGGDAYVNEAINIMEDIIKKPTLASNPTE